MNVVLEDFDATIEHLEGLYGFQFVADLDNKEWHAALVVLGRVLFEVFTPHAWLLNSRYGPHYLGVEFEVMDMIYHLPFRDWLELNTRLPTGTIASADNEPENGGSGDNNR
jgi:hypothetical protein